MKYEGWEMLDISETEFNEMESGYRDNFFRSWLKSAKAKQIEKGII